MTKELSNQPFFNFEGKEQLFYQIKQSLKKIGVHLPPPPTKGDIHFGRTHKEHDCSPNALLFYAGCELQNEISYYVQYSYVGYIPYYVRVFAARFKQHSSETDEFELKIINALKPFIKDLKPYRTE